MACFQFYEAAAWSAACFAEAENKGNRFEPIDDFCRHSWPGLLYSMKREQPDDAPRKPVFALISMYTKHSG